MTVDLEFLIQKEGDFAWLPLESLTIEILVGRYQLIAQASEADCPIQVHIRHQYVQNGIWQEEVQQQLLRTDSQGRIEVLPPTFLQHGRWLISCAPNEHEQLAHAEIDRHCVQLQVLEQDVDLDQEWEFLDAPIGTYPDLNLQEADLLAPLQAANITSKTAWNNLIPTERTIPELGELLDTTPADDSEQVPAESSSIVPELEELLDTTPADDGEQVPVESSSIVPELEDLLDITPADDGEQVPVESSSFLGKTPKTESNPTLPKLPVIPKDVPPIRLQISPGIILPPALFDPNFGEDGPPAPQLPVFPHLDNWQKLSYKELSIALGRLHWSKLDAHGEAIDLDFESLELQERFLQTLNGLALQEVLASNFGDPALSGQPTPELNTPEQSTTLVPSSLDGEP